ncbi:MAG TPA: hypothetical protein VGI04_00615 [Neobacillus sp.]
MKSATVLEKAYTLCSEGEKSEILRELSALLLTIPNTRKKTRSYVQKAMNYIEKH